MTTLSTRSFLGFAIFLCAARLSAPPSRSAAHAQSRKASHASVPLFVRLAGAQLPAAKKALGKPLSEGPMEGVYFFAGRPCGCDKIDVYANQKDKITSISAYFNKELTWQDALKKVGISDKGVSAKVHTMPPVGDMTRTETDITGISAVHSGLHVVFYTESYTNGKHEYTLTIKK